MNVSSAVVRRLLLSRAVPATVDSGGLLEAARSPRHKLAVTLLSCLAAEGQRLTSDQVAELDAHRARANRYADVWSRLLEIAPQATVVKGPRIADHYPAGVLRAAGDLDVVDHERTEVWRAALVLLDDGWHVEAFTVLPRDGAYDVLLSIQRDSDTLIPDPYEVELRTTDVATSLNRPPVRFDTGTPDPVVPSIVALAAERFERRFTSRDVLDLAVLSAAVTDAGRAALSPALTTARLWPAYQELSRLVERADLDGVGPLPADRLRTLRQRLVDRPSRLAVWSHPVRAAGFLATATADVDRGQIADRLARTLHERLGGRRLLRAGVPLFGVPVDHRAVDDLRLLDRGHRLLAATPVGTFLLTAGACPEEWLADLDLSILEAG